ncbi:MAG: dihydropteroate synthase [Candidatus Dormibacteria bacterium]
MSATEPGPPAVRLLPPYPEPAWLGPESELALRVELPLAAPPTEVAAWLGPEVRVAADSGRLVLLGTLAALRAAAATREPATALLAETLSRALAALGSPAPPLRLQGESWEFGQRTYVLGVVNVTPDSFSGDGVGGDPGAALARARELVAEGADALDLGGESTRPGHTPVTAEQELARVLPALRLIAAALPVPVFVDTSKAVVAEAVLGEGAAAINDVWGLRRDPGMAEVVAAAGVPVICMHNQDGNEYQDLVGEVLACFRESLARAGQAGIPAQQVVLDPGLGFGKGHAQNLEVLRRLPELRVLGPSLLVGPSRKSLIGWLLDERPPGERLLGTAAVCAWAVAHGADWVRVHDVAAIRDVVRVTDALARRPSG